jgi:hypothetical protein
MNYLVDTYLIYAASVLAANSVYVHSVILYHDTALKFQQSSLIVWCCVSAFHFGHVPQPWNQLGIDASSIPGIGMCADATSVLQGWRAHSITLQVRS